MVELVGVVVVVAGDVIVVGDVRRVRKVVGVVDRCTTEASRERPSLLWSEGGGGRVTTPFVGEGRRRFGCLPRGECLVPSR